jgi:hypothetical protein
MPGRPTGACSTTGPTATCRAGPGTRPARPSTGTGIKDGDLAKVYSRRDYIRRVAVVTKRLRQLEVAGKKVHTIGIPIHRGVVGIA